MNNGSADEVRLIEKAQVGDEGACLKLLNLYKGRIFSYVYRMVRNYHDAEEITLETFVRCFKSLRSFDRGRTFSPWLFTISHNLIIDFFRRNKVSYEHLDEEHAAKDDFVKRYEEKKRLEMIEKGLACLDPMDREIVLLFHKEDKSYQEISEILNVPVSTLKTRLHRAREKIRELIREDG